MVSLFLSCHTHLISHRLMALPEIERERILADRADQKQQLEDEKILSQMVREQRGAVAANGDEERVSAAAKRT